MTASIPPEVERLLLSGWLVSWLRSAELQAKRVDPARGSTFADGQVDAMLFALAVANVDRTSTAILGEGSSAIRTYRGAIPDGKAIRDMLTHFDEYVRDQGRLQRNGAVQGFNVFFERDRETVTVHIADLSLRVADAFAAASDFANAALTVLHGDEVAVMDNAATAAPACDQPRTDTVGP
jgi:hypothetical protein